MIAKNVIRTSTFELKHHLIEFTCPKCNIQNDAELIEETDLNHSQDNFYNCRVCSHKIIVKAKDIFK